MWFFSHRTARPNTSERLRRHSYRPRLEVLEDRAVPASLSYSTLLNGTVLATAVDSAGDIYVTGETTSLPTTPGAFETTGAGAEESDMVNSLFVVTRFSGSRRASGATELPDIQKR